MALAFASTAFAADYASVDVDRVTDRATGQTSLAQYLRVGKEVSGIQLGLQGRTARYDDNTGMSNSLEFTAGKSFGLPVTPFVGVGYDNGKNGAVNGQYTYGLVGLTTGTKVGPGYLMGGVKTRVNFDSANPKQTVTFASYSVPVAKAISVNLNLSHSAQDIQERSLGFGVSVGF